MKLNKGQIKKLQNECKGITLTALVITIVVLMILTGVTLSLTIGDNGIILRELKAKEQAEIAGEKEIVQTSAFEAQYKNKDMNLIEEEFQIAMDNNTGKGKTTVDDLGDEFEVAFLEKNRYYTVDKDGQLIGEGEIAVDENPGDITTGKDGEELDGSKEHPYEIWCIEDLVAFSNMTNGSGIIIKNGKAEQVTKSNSMEEKYVILKVTLNFKSKLSYINSERTDFGDINGSVEDGNTLINEMQTGTGFNPILDFAGDFNGENNEIKNIYIKRDGNAALFTSKYKGVKKIANLGITGNITSMQNSAVGIAMGAKNIENCWNKADITTLGESNNVRGAGIKVATREGAANIKNCYNTGKITSVAGFVAGIVASNGGDTIEYCYNTGDITNGKKSWYIGGIASGHGNAKTTIRNCYNTGKIEGSGSLGGILGVNGDIIENCYNIGEVSGDSGSYAGGVVGRDINEIYNCYNTGNIKGKYIGGISYKTANKTRNCYNSGKIDGNRVGGIFGTNENENPVISNCFNVGDLIYQGYDSFAGGILGRNLKQITINNTYSIGKIIEKGGWNTNASAGILASNKGTVNLNKCYYLLTEGVDQAIDGTEDDRENVTACTSISEITPEILNNNINIIQHEEEWKPWKLCADGYPMFEI